MQTVLAPTDTEIVIRVAGAVDNAEAEFLRELLGVFAISADTVVVVDLAQVHLLDSIGLGVLISADKQFRAHGRVLQLRSPQPPIRRVLDAIGLAVRLDQDR